MASRLPSRPRLRRFFFDNVKWVLRIYGLTLFLAFLSIGLKERHIIHKWLTWIEDNVAPLPAHGTLSDIVLTAVLAFLVAKLGDKIIQAFLPTDLEGVLRRWLLPLNTDLTSEHLKQVVRYLDAAGSLMRKEIRPDDPRAIVSDTPLIKLKGRASLVSGDSSSLQDHLEDVVDALDCSYLLDSGKTLPPLVLQGDPGAGKSTLMFELFHTARTRLEESSHGWIPLIVFVRHLSLQLVQSCRTMHELLVRYFKNLSSDDGRMKGMAGFAEIADFLATHYDSYRFLIIFDGLDEFGDRRTYEEMAASLDRLIDPRPDQERKDGYATFPGANRYVVSCRTEDNQKKILGNLITLYPPEWEQVLTYLDEYRRRCREGSKERDRISGSIRGLKASKENGLLRNYMTNPYLLSLIVMYYEHPTPKLATTLETVFDRVLERELAKSSLSSHSDGLSYYIVRLLSPYAYIRVTSSLKGSDEEVDFLKVLRTEPELSTILFGDGATAGYLAALFLRDVNRELELQAELGALWGKDETKAFRALLLECVSTCASLSEFEVSAAARIKSHLFGVLRESNLAVLTADDQGIDHFRHRRLQDYFVALYIDHVGVHHCPAVREHVTNAWLREPLRIYAAIGRAPEDLLSECTSHFHRIATDESLDIFHRLNKAGNLLLNASSAVAYLPSSPERQPRQELTNAVLALGKQVHDLYHLVVSPQATGATGSEGDVLRRKCLECLRNIYGSEYLSTQGIQKRFNIFGTLYKTSQGRDFNGWLGIYRRTLKEGESYQQISYRFLYPIRAGHDDFPVGRFSLFLFVMEVVLLFRYKYVELICTTHRQFWSRFPIWISGGILRLGITMLLLLALWVDAGLFGFGGIVLLVFVLLAYWYLAQFFIERGMIGETREATVAVPWLILAGAKRWFARQLAAPDLPINQFPVQLISRADVSASERVQLGTAGSDRQTRGDEKKSSPPRRRHGHQPSWATVKSHLATWPVVVISCFVMLALLSPLVLRVSQLAVHIAQVLELGSQTSELEKQISRLGIESVGRAVGDREKAELEDFYKELSAESDQVDRLVSTGEALAVDAPSGLANNYLRRTRSRLTSARQRIREMDLVISELLERVGNSAEWDALNKSIADIRSSTGSLQEARPDASPKEIETMLESNEHLRSQLRDLAATATTFRGRHLRGGKLPDTAPPLSVVDSLDQILADRQTHLTAALSAAQLREDASTFFDEVPVLLREIKAEERVKVANASLELLRSEAGTTDDLQNRLDNLVSKGRWLKSQSISVRMGDAIEQELKKLEEVSDPLSERAALVQRWLRATEFKTAFPEFVVRVEKTSSDVLSAKTTTFRDPSDALAAIDQIRQRVDESVQEAAGLKEEAQDDDAALKELDGQILRLNEDLADLELQTAKWGAQLDAEDKKQAVEALRVRIKDVLSSAPTSLGETDSLIARINSIQADWDGLGRPVELLGDIRKLTPFLHEIERNRQRWRPEEASTKQTSKGTPEGKNPVLEARCLSLSQDFKPDESKIKDLDAFLSEDAAALSNEVDRISSGPKVFDLLLTYGRARHHLERIRQVEPSLQPLKRAASSFLVDANDVTASSEISKGCRERLSQLLNSAQDISSRLSSVEQIAQRLQAEDFDHVLIKNESQAKQMAWSAAILLLASSVLVVIAIACFIVFSKRCDRRGLAELRNHRTFEDQLGFIVSNGFSRKVNLKAISQLQMTLKSPPPDALQMLGDAAQAREKRGPGVLNGDIATHLRELARGVDNILNR